MSVFYRASSNNSHSAFNLQIDPRRVSVSNLIFSINFDQKNFANPLFTIFLPQSLIKFSCVYLLVYDLLTWIITVFALICPKNPNVNISADTLMQIEYIFQHLCEFGNRFVEKNVKVYK
ncbi:hypothetical protein CDIK_1378 [Cucumispora dikerogammari]|nr:hypothetical protein CDIK_1378 [Cucumispora dikerogammari]